MSKEHHTLDQIDIVINRDDDPGIVAQNFMEALACIGIAAEAIENNEDRMTVRVHNP